MNATLQPDAAQGSTDFSCMCRLSLVDGEVGLTLFYVDSGGTGFGPEIVSLTGKMATDAAVWPKGLVVCAVPPQSLSDQVVEISLQPLGGSSVYLELKTQGQNGLSRLAWGELVGTGLGQQTVSGVGQFGTAAPFALATSTPKLVIEVEGGSGNAGAALVLGEHSWADREKWRMAPASVAGYYYLVSVASGLVAGADRSSSAPGAPLVLQEREGNDHQLWSVEHPPIDPSRVVFASKANPGLVIDLRGAKVEPGTVIQQWTRNQQFNQQWLMMGSRL